MGVKPSALIFIMTAFLFGCDLNTGTVDSGSSEQKSVVTHDIPGTWSLTSTWRDTQLQSHSLQLEITFYANETFRDSEQMTGTWFADSELIFMWYDDNQLRYEGNYRGKTMSGRATDGADPIYRYWSAIKTANP